MTYLTTVMYFSLKWNIVFQKQEPGIRGWTGNGHMCYIELLSSKRAYNLASLSLLLHQDEQIETLIKEMPYIVFLQLRWR